MVRASQQAEGFLIASPRELDQFIFLDHRFSSFFEVVYIDRRARSLVGAKAKKFSTHTDGGLMRGAPGIVKIHGFFSGALLSVCSPAVLNCLYSLNSNATSQFSP